MKAKPWMFVAAIWLWPAVFNVVNLIVGWLAFGWNPPSPSDLVFAFGDWLGYALFTPAIFHLANRWPVVRPQLVRRVAVHVAFALAFCVAWALGGKLLSALLILIFDHGQFVQVVSGFDAQLVGRLAMNVANWIMTTIPFGVVVYTTVLGLAHAIGYYGEARDREVQLALTSEQLTRARFAALESQLNPHFMFNTLNTIAVLTRDGDRTAAVRIIEHFSEMLRRTLGRHRGSEVSVAEEFDLVAQYVAIEEARIPDRLRVAVDVPDALRSAAVPGFVIQHLVENAIRHGVAKRPEAGRVSVAVRREEDSLVIAVRDDGPGIAAGAPPAGHGIVNTQERLRALYGDGASLTVVAAPSGGTVATARIPYREIIAEAAYAR